MAYVHADLQQKDRITIDLRPEMKEKLSSWALSEIVKAAEKAGVQVDVKDTLKEAGFEYSITDAKVEVTLNSVVQTLSEMIGPSLREAFDQIADEEKAGQSG